MCYPKEIPCRNLLGRNYSLPLGQRSLPANQREQIIFQHWEELYTPYRHSTGGSV